MTPDHFRVALEKLGLTQGQAAWFLGISIRTINGYANNQYPVPRSVALLLRLMIRYDIKPESLK
jgi:DNA-binding XRE family transcriptional regulator